MKRCPTCNRTFTDETLSFCLDDGSPLLDASGAAGPQSYGPNIKPPQSQANAPAPTVAYRPETIPAPQPTPSWQQGQQQQYAPPPRKRRVWPWVVGILGVLGVLFIGFIVLIAALASMGANANNANNSRANTNYSNNRSSNRSTYNSNSNSASTVDSTNTSSNDTDNSSKTYSQSDVQITSLNMAHDDGKGQPGKETDSFSPSERTIYCVVHLSKLKAGTKVKFLWYAISESGKDQLIKELDYNTGAFENIVNAHLTLPQDWPTGDYRVDVSVDDGPTRSLEYSVE